MDNPEQKLKEMGDRNRALFVRVNILEQTMKLFIKWLQFPNKTHFTAIRNVCKNLVGEKEEK